MVVVDQHEYVAGGYFIARPVPRPTWVSAELFPPLLFCTTSCIGEMTPDTWGVVGTEDGVAAERVPALQAWAAQQFSQEQIGRDNVLFSVEVARAFVIQFLPDDRDLVIVGIGLHSTWVPTFLASADHARPGEQRAEGIITMLRRNTPLAPGDILGFEVMGREYSWLHSWLCN